MMNSPEGYKKENENKSIEELILERTRLFNEMVEYEQKHIINNEPEEVAKPSPKDIYNMHNLYLKEITDLIVNKRDNNIVTSDSEYNDKEYVKELEKLEKRLFNKGGFYLEIRSGAVLPIKHPHYYDGRVDIVLDDHFGKPNCSAKIEKNEYSVNDEQFNKIKQMIKEKFNLLFEIAKKQTDEMYSGTYNSMLIKFNSVLLNISPDNVTNENDFNVFNELKSAIMDIIIPKNEEKFEKTINDLVNKVIALPIGTETSISNLLGDKLREFNTNQLFQINKRVLGICKERGIIFNFDKYKDQAVGLPFNIPFIISEELTNSNLNNLEFYKKNDDDKIWWINNKEQVGEHLFTFDKKTIFNLFKDYPYKLTSEEKEIFDKENPYWADYFKDRK